MSSIINAFLKVRGSSSTSKSNDTSTVYVADNVDSRVSTSPAWGMTVISEPAWCFGFHFCEEDAPVTATDPKPPHKHVHSKGDECLRNFKVCQFSKVLNKKKLTLYNLFCFITLSPTNI